ncbi:hypothetical protein XFF6970_770002 [Xanthomonas citri pv. fuscans]|nr:hypothetical protein XFF6970_770002 [Xanthomonas citri pv. fuscans]
MGACAQGEGGEQGVEGAPDHEASVVRWCGCDASGIGRRGQLQGFWQLIDVTLGNSRLIAEIIQNFQSIRTE